VYSSIQVWPRKDAPTSLHDLLGRDINYDWVALVPAVLNDQEVTDLLMRNAGDTPVRRANLSDGSLLLAGKFAGQESHGRMPLERRSSNCDKAKSAAR
jgi:hypothetical protein